MRHALVLAAIAAVAVARPETYKEKEDFQYSRSSSDDGTKSGYYGAQRGNMGGNYERSHNMDSLAQHHMGSLVRTVDGELGDGAKQQSGSVFTAANSRGVFGNGHYDLSNLEGRSFQEGASYADSLSHSSLSSLQNGYGSQSHSYSTADSGFNSAYGKQSQNSRYLTAGNADQALYTSNVQSANNLQASDHDSAQLQGTGYRSQSGYQGQNVYDQAAATQHASSAYGISNNRGSSYRLVGASPVRVYVRPGSTVTVPIAAQSYDASQGSTSYDTSQASTLHGVTRGSSTRDASGVLASTFDHNSINDDAGVQGINNLRTFKPTNDAKRYESSYSYRKEWEKHDTVPVTAVPLAIPTANPFPAYSELYEGAQVARGADRQLASGAQEAKNVHSSSQYRGYNVKTGSSRQQSAYLGHSDSEAASVADSSVSRQQSAYLGHRDSEAASVADSSASRQQSAYLGHRDSEAASAASSSANTRGAYNYGASNLNSANLNGQVENFGSKPKHYESSFSYHKSWERQGDPYVIVPATNGLYTAANTQASQRLTSSTNQGSSYGSHQHGAHYHQGYSSDCDENGYTRVARSYNSNPNSYQLNQNHNEGQEYLGQQVQNLADFGQQSQKLKDLGQQSQNLEDLGQQSQNLEDLGQQSQNLEDLGQQPQNLEDLGQQSQNLQDFGQKSQNLEKLGQQSQNLEDLGQQSQNIEDLGQQSQNLKDLGQQPQNLEDLGQQSQNLQDFGQQSQNLENLGQQSQNLEDLGQQSQNIKDLGQQSQNLKDFRQPTQNLHDFGQQSQNPENLGQQPQNLQHFGQQAQSLWDQHSQTDVGQETQNTWNMFETIQYGKDQDTIQQTEGSPFEINNPLLHKTESQTVDVSKPNPFAHTGRDISNQHSIDIGKEDVRKGFIQTEDVVKQPGQQTQLYWHSYQSNVNENGSLSPFGLDRMYQDRIDWQKQLDNRHININTGYGHNHHNQYQTEFDSNSWVFNKPSSVNAQNLGNSNTGNEFPSLVLNPPYSHLNDYFIKPGYGNSYTNTQTYNNKPISENTYTNTHITHINQSTYSTSNIQVNSHNSGTTSLTNLWDLIDDMEKETISTTETEFNSRDWYHKEKNDSNLIWTHHGNKQFSNKNDKEHPNESTTSITTTAKQDNLRSNDNTERGDVGPEKHRPQEEPGRGDIGPQDEYNEDIHTIVNPLQFMRPNLSKQYKSPEEIETLSLTKENNKTDSVHTPSPNKKKQINLVKNEKQSTTVLGVVTLNDQKNLNTEQDIRKLQNDIQLTTSTTPKSSYSHVQHHFIGEHERQHNSVHQFDKLGHVENSDQQSYNQQTFDKKNYSLSQQNDHHLLPGQQSEPSGQESNFTNIGILGQENVNLDQQNMDQQFEILGQLSQDLSQQSFNQFEDLGQQSEHLGKESKFTNFGNFDQENVNLEQNVDKHMPNLENESKDIEQQNMGQQFEILGQQSQDLSQQSFNQFEDLGQQSEHLGKESQFTNFGNFDQENVNLDQQNVDKHMPNLENKSKDIQQQNMGQQFEILGQQSQDLSQQSFNQFEDLGQQSEHLGKESKFTNFGNFDQENVNLDQQNVDKHMPNLEIGSKDIQQQNMDQQFEFLGQQAQDLSPQSFNQFEDLGQQSEHLGQEHQQPDTFRHQNNRFQQESLWEFGQHEQFKPESLHNFDQQSETLLNSQKEKKIEKFGKEENKNLEQQNQNAELWKPDVQKVESPQVEVFKPISNIREDRAPNHKPVVEPETGKVGTHTINVETPPEPVTEKVGFWGKVGSKLSSAKDKVKSWFSSS